VVDFEDGLDLLDFRAFGFASEADVLDLAEQVGADVLFSLPDGGSVRLAQLRHRPARHRGSSII
jgi:hypothetical protein